MVQVNISNAYTLHKVQRHTKKAGLQSCCSAHPALVLPFIRTATPKPTPYIYGTRIRVHSYTYHGHLSAAIVLLLRIYQIQMSQNNALKTPFHYVRIPPHYRTFPLAWAIQKIESHAVQIEIRRKITTNFWHMQIYCTFFCKNCDFLRNGYICI